MTVLRPADAAETADLAAFLGRLVKWDKTAVVRLQGRPVPDGAAVAVFGRPPFGEVLAVRTYQLDGLEGPLDVTVSAGQLLEGIDEAAGQVVVPPGVTGPSWAGLLPPRSGWRRIAEPDADGLRAVAGAVVAEFRARTEAQPPAHRTRDELDTLAEEIWSRPLGTTALPLRAVHAAHALGFLRPLRGAANPIPDPETTGAKATGSEARPALLSCGPWLRLRTPYGSVAVRDRTGPGLSVSPV
jgi:hypothetical protein